MYSHKTHEKRTDILLSRLARIKLWQIVLSAATAGGCTSILFGTDRVGALASVVVSTVLLCLNTYTKNHDLGELSEKHRSIAADLWVIRERYISLIADLRMQTEPIEALIRRRDDLLDALQVVYSRAPSTNDQAYKRAQEALKRSEDMTFADDREVDAFLPVELKKSQ